MQSENSHPEVVTFRTKVDFWLVLVLVASLGGGLLGTVVAFDPAIPGTWIPLSLLLGSTLLIGLFSIPTEYTLSDETLVIRFGTFRRVVPYSGIERVHPSRNPLSSPAWSLDRIAIHYREGRSRQFALISPVQRDEFLEMLRQRARLHESPRGLVPSNSPD